MLRDGQQIARYFKQLLPNFGVFDEQRYFAAGEESCVFELDGIQIGAPITLKGLDTDKGVLTETTLQPASEEEIAGTVAVMGVRTEAVKNAAMESITIFVL